MLTYGVYLLHPIAYQIVLLAFKKFDLAPDPYAVIIATVLTTLVLAQVSFRLLEEPFIRIGKKLTAKRQRQGHASRTPEGSRLPPCKKI